ncbi:hypothetical protein FNL55_12595 [Tardiphaga sp. vice352]|uniref:hypothetical protein n=1 Tax=Tardiphaga sp. vice352 TaxID=2592816 RepID=UPI001163E70B|nr:hypothetical protein [Tardiphaga sp. vice352]QDM32077.1 hypothetical protein FNL55_12595 [Tardiphaga sp. vice352]
MSDDIDDKVKRRRAQQHRAYAGAHSHAIDTQQSKRELLSILADAAANTAALQAKLLSATGDA